MKDFYFKLNCRFTEYDKEKCIPTINRLIELANVARIKGLLALELEMKQEQSVFFKTALSLVIDATEPMLIKHILQNLIMADEYSGSQLLDRLLIAEGVLALQQGESPHIIAIKLYAMLGEKYISAMNGMGFYDNSEMAKYYAFLETLKNKEPLPESESFESILLQLDNRAIELIMRSIDRRYLIPALHGCGFHLIKKVFENVSLNTCRTVSENWGCAKPLRKEAVSAAQEEILKTIKKLEDAGEIAGIGNIGK